MHPFHCLEGIRTCLDLIKFVFYEIRSYFSRPTNGLFIDHVPFSSSAFLSDEKFSITGQLNERSSYWVSGLLKITSKLGLNVRVFSKF